MLMIVRVFPALAVIGAIAGVLTPGVARAGGAADQGAAMSHVRVEVGLDRAAVAPGGSGTIGVRFLIEDGWHLYWRNSGDSGMPISVTFEAPEGVRIGPLQWPAPRRYVYGNGSVDYIYERETALLADVEIGDQYQPGDRIEITALFELLACREACVFGMGERLVVIEIAESTTMREPGWMKKNRARIPKLVDLGDRLRWDGTDLLISVYANEGINRVTFFPYAPSEPAPLDPLDDGTSETGRLRVAYPPAIVEAPRVAGVLEIDARMSSGPHWIEIETAPPSAPPSLPLSAPAGGSDANEPTPRIPTHTTQNRSGD